MDKSIIYHIRQGKYDGRLDQIEIEIRNRKRQIDLDKRGEAFAQSLNKWSAAKNRPHRRGFVGGEIVYNVVVDD